jgi:SHS2 domain-containing protein
MGSSQGAGHRTVPHTADVRIEAWAASREQCVAEAVRAMVDGCVDTDAAQPTSTHVYHRDEASDEELLVNVLEEVIYRMEVAQEVPVTVDVISGDGVEVRFGMAPLAALLQVGAAPKAVSLHELRFGPGNTGWSCSVTVDV